MVMRISALLLLLLTLLPPVPVVLAETALGAGRETRAQREARIAHENAAGERGEKLQQEMRDEVADAMEAGKAKAEEYGRNNPVDGFPDPEVRIQENWDATTNSNDYEIHWQYRLVYTDSFGNPQYEAYFDEQGNVTTPLRESPERVALRRVKKEMGEDNEGPFTVAWSFSEDNEGREYPESIIVQGEGAVNRVQMQFDEYGVPYTMDIRDADGNRTRGVTGNDSRTYGDEGPALATVTWPRPVTGPCEKCRSLMEARNDVLLELVPLGNEINRLAGVHARLNTVAREEQIHIQKFELYRQEHAAALQRFQQLEKDFAQADSSWRACEETCVEAVPPEDNSLALNSGLPSPLLVNVAQDSALLCTFGDPFGPISLHASPVSNGPGSTPAETSGAAGDTGPATSNPSANSPGGESTDSGQPGSSATSGTSASSTGGGYPGDNSASSQGAPPAPGNSGSPQSAGPSGSAPVGVPTGTSASSTSGAGTTSDTSGSGDTPAGPGSKQGIPIATTGSSSGDNPADQQPPTTSEAPETSTPAAPTALTVILVKASLATMTAGANVGGMTAQLAALQPGAVDTAALPTDDCGGGSCDWWKEDQSCGSEWICDESDTDYDLECSGSGCEDYAAASCDSADCAPLWQSDCSGSECDFTVTDPNCTGSDCAPMTCSGNDCGWDIGFDQDPVKCAMDASGSCSLEVDAMQQAAGTYFVVVDGFGGGNSDTGTYTLELDAVDSEGITVQSEGADLSALDPEYQQYVSDPLVVDGTTWYTLLYPSALSAQIQAALALIPGLGIIAIDPCWLKWKVPNDPYYQSSGTWEQAYPDQWALHRIGFAPKGKNAWDELGDDGKDVIVAVIDSGIDWNHRDLAWRNIWFNGDEIADNGLDDDNNGFIDDRIGWDFWSRDNRPWDEDGHGTIVAGIIAARADNGIGIAGINPTARIMPLRAMNSFGHTRASYVARALVYAVDNGARVVNLSVGGAGESDVFRAAVDYAESKGVLVVAAAGNEATELNGILPGDHPAVLTVAALDTADQRAAFSNYGTQVDIAAPGVDILSLRARFTDTMLGIGDIEYSAGQATIGADRRYYRAGGTSFAAPMVTGVASLLLSKNPQLQADELRRILRNSAADVAKPGWDRLTGFGRVNATAALQADPAYYIEARIHGLAMTQQDGNTVVAVTGSADANKFESAEVLLGQGADPQRWRRVATLKKAQLDSALAYIPGAALQGGGKHFTVRLIVKHKDGSSREVRFGLDLG